MGAVLTYTIRAKDEFSDIFERLVNISDTASGFIIAKLGLEAARAVGTMTSSAVEDFSDVELSLKRMAAAVGAYGDAADEMVEDIRAQLNAGQEFGFTMQETAQILQMLTMAGYSVDDSFKALTPIMKTATIESMSLQEAVTLTTTILGMYGLNAEDAGRVTEVLANAAVHGILPISKIGMGLAYVGKQAANMGSSLEETTAALVQATNQGLRAHMAGRYLRRMFEDLVDAEDELGFSIRDATGEMYNLTKIIELLDDHMATLKTGYEKSTYISKIFGVQAQTLVYALTGVDEQGNKNVDTLKALTASMTEAGTATEMAKEIVDTFWGSMRQFKSVISDISYDIGQNLAPVIQALIPPATAAARVLSTTLAPVLGMVTATIRTLTPVFNSLAWLFERILPTVAALTTAYIGLKIVMNAVRFAANNYLTALFYLDLQISTVIINVYRWVKALSLVPQWMGVIGQKNNIILRNMSLLSQTIAAFAAGLRGVTGVTFVAQRATVAYTLALQAHNIVTIASTFYMNTLGKAILAVASAMKIGVGAATALAYVFGGIVLIAAIWGLIRAAQWLSTTWKNVVEDMKRRMAGATLSIINDLNMIKTTIETLQMEMDFYGRNLNALDYIYQTNEMRIKSLQDAMENGTISVAEAAAAISVLEKANQRLAPIIQASRLEESKLRDEISNLIALEQEESKALEALKEARIAVTAAMQKEYGRQKLTAKEYEELTAALDNAGISYEELTRGFWLGKRRTIDLIQALQDLDSVISGHELTKEDLRRSLEDLQLALDELANEVGMTTTDWDAFWRELESTTSMRGRSMLAVLEQLGVAVGALDYTFGATNREIERLNLRYRENELMIREIEKAMKEGKISYIEAQAQIRALREENEEIALARDEARLEQDKLNLATEEATETIAAYQRAIEEIIRSNEGLLKRKYELEDKMASGAQLTEAEKEEYEKLNEAIVANQARLDDLQTRLDSIKERFPAIESGLMNLRDAIRNFASDLDQNFIGPVDESMLGLIDDLETAFSTEFDFVPPTIDWSPIFDTLATLTETDWTINVKLLIEESGLDQLKDFLIEDQQEWNPLLDPSYYDEDLAPYVDWPIPGWDEVSDAGTEFGNALEVMGEAALNEATSYLAFADAVGSAITGTQEAVNQALETYGEAQLIQSQGTLEFAKNIGDRLAGFFGDPLGSLERGFSELQTMLSGEPKTQDVKIDIVGANIYDQRDIIEIAEEIAWEITRAEDRQDW